MMHSLAAGRHIVAAIGPYLARRENGARQQCKRKPCKESHPVFGGTRNHTTSGKARGSSRVTAAASELQAKKRENINYQAKCAKALLDSAILMVFSRLVMASPSRRYAVINYSESLKNMGGPAYNRATP